MSYGVQINDGLFIDDFGAKGVGERKDEAVRAPHAKLGGDGIAIWESDEDYCKALYVMSS